MKMIYAEFMDTDVSKKTTYISVQIIDPKSQKQVLQSSPLGTADKSS